MGAVLPIVGAVVDIVGGIVGSNEQNQQNKANQAATSNENAAIGQEQSLAQQLASGPYLQSLIDAEGSGVKTLQSTLGGVANPGAEIQSLFGGNIQSALGAALGQRNSALGSAANIESGVANQYKGEVTPTQGNPWLSAATGAIGALSGLGNKPTGAGSIVPGITPGGDIGNPNPYNPSQNAPPGSNWGPTP